MVRLPNDPLQWPPHCFLTTAVHALRSESAEIAVLLVDPIGEAAADRLVNRSHAADFAARVQVLDKRNASQLPSSLSVATRVIWADSPSHMPISRRRPFEALWTWCPESTSACEPLPRHLADFQVQARPLASHGDDRQANHGHLHARHCSRPFEVRSDWTRSQWVNAMDSVVDRRHPDRHLADPVRGEWVLDDACLVYRANTPVPEQTKSKFPGERFSLLMQSQSSTRQLLWPLPWPSIFSEFTPSMKFNAFDQDPVYTMPAWTTTRYGLQSPPRSHQCTWHNETSVFLTEMTMDNLFHAFIHAVPTREHFERLGTLAHRGALQVLPHYLTYWPRNASFIGWQILVHSLGFPLSDWKAVATRALRLTVNAPTSCNCFKRIYGGHRSWMPPPFSSAEDSRKRVAYFRMSIAATLGSPVPQQRRILFQLRRNGARQVVNEAELRAGIESDPVVGKVVHFAVMEELRIMDQFELVQTSTSLAGVHGMGLAWTMLLPSDARGSSSCLEILGQWPSFQRNDYYQLSRANNVYYMRIEQRTSPECFCYGCHYRVCGNITADLSQIVPVLRFMVSRWDPSRVLEDTFTHRKLPPKRCHALNKYNVSCDRYL